MQRVAQFESPHFKGDYRSRLHYEIGGTGDPVVLIHGFWGGLANLGRSVSRPGPTLAWAALRHARPREIGASYE